MSDRLSSYRPDSGENGKAKTFGPDISEVVAQMTEGATDIKVAVAARIGNPLFDALPDLIRSAPKDAIFTIVFMYDEKTLNEETIRRIKEVEELSKQRQRPDNESEPYTDIIEDDPKNVSLDIKVDPEFPDLSVFIRDPSDPKQYWFRRIGITPSTVQMGDTEIPSIDIEQYPMGPLYSHPCPADTLEIAVSNIIKNEEEVSNRDDIPYSQAAVAIARYQGDKILTVDGILRLVAIRYHELRQKFLEQKQQNPE